MNKTHRLSRFFAEPSARVLACAAALLLCRLPIAAQCNWTPGSLKITETCGNVGIGTTNPVIPLDTRLPVSKTDTSTYGVEGFDILSNDVVNPAGFDVLLRGDPTTQANRWVALQTSEHNVVNGGMLLFQPFGGNVGIGTTAPATRLHVVGDVTVTGNIAAKYQDLAEWVPTRGLIEAGTVVIVDSGRRNGVVPSERAYDTRVAGVISAKPGMLLGEGGEGKVMVATTGRVKVKVDATRGAIEAGDLLVTSDREGYAMVSEPVSVGSVAIHRPGTLIGKALEPLERGQGEILVLLSLQ